MAKSIYDCISKKIEKHWFSLALLWFGIFQMFIFWLFRMFSLRLQTLEIKVEHIEGILREVPELINLL